MHLTIENPGKSEKRGKPENPFKTWRDKKFSEKMHLIIKNPGKCRKPGNPDKSGYWRDKRFSEEIHLIIKNPENVVNREIRTNRDTGKSTGFLKIRKTWKTGISR